MGSSAEHHPGNWRDSFWDFSLAVDPKPCIVVAVAYAHPGYQSMELKDGNLQSLILEEKGQQVGGPIVLGSSSLFTPPFIWCVQLFPQGKGSLAQQWDWGSLGVLHPRLARYDLYPMDLKYLSMAAVLFQTPFFSKGESSMQAEALKGIPGVHSAGQVEGILLPRAWHK